MRKEGLFVLLVLFLILNISFIFAALENVSDASAKGYACLESKTKDCSSLSSEEKIFSLMAAGNCKQEVLNDALNGECWPKSGCKLKTTSEAMLALKAQGTSVNKSIDWLLRQKISPTGLDFLLQIETSNTSKCTVSYSGNSYILNINENKQITGNTGTCLTIYSGGYWLQVKNTCYDKEFEISCNKSFITSVIYKDSASQTIYVPQQTNSASAEGKTKEKVNAYCLKQGSSCDYEGNLWAAMSLKSLGFDASSFIPYLVTKQAANEQYLPESFLYVLLGDAYRNDLLLRQKENKWWLESGDKFYDTALALYPFQYEEITEKSNAISWLEEVQGSDGCWQNNVRNTAFLLYSIWPKKVSVEPAKQDCEDSGYFCMSKANCDSVSGEELSYSGCFGINTCCSKEKPLDICSDQNGAICGSEEVCTGSTIDAADLKSGETCCIDGRCEMPSVQSQCETYGGNCRTTCLSNEQQSSYSCGSGVCCLPVVKKAGNYTLIIILSILIILVFLGIIFRKKLKDIFSKIKFRGKGKPAAKFSPRGFPPGTSSIQPRMMPRRIIPSQPVRPIARPLPAKKPGEMDEVLKKLREIGK